MGFKVVSPGSQVTRWYPVVTATTLYIGQLVYVTGAGAAALGAASGASNTTNKRVPLGVVVGTSNRAPLYNSTYKTQYITQADTQATVIVRENATVGGVYPVGDPSAFVEVMEIGPETEIEGQIYVTTFGVAPSVLTATAATTDGLSGIVTATPGFTPVTNNATIYCRSGANAGIMKNTSDTSTTTPVITAPPFPYDSAVGDKFVRVNVAQCGKSRVQFDSTSQFVDSAAALTSDYFFVHVTYLDLSEAYKEIVRFKFDGDNFTSARA